MTSKTKPEARFANNNTHDELDTLVNMLISDPSEIKGLLDGISKDKGSHKYLHEKAVRTISETKPDLLLPHMELMLELANGKNVFIRCCAIISLSNLIPKAPAGAALDAFKGYMALMESDSLLIAGNASGNAWKIAKAWPGLEPCITKKLLSIPSRTFVYKGEPSPECGNIMVGHALECLARYFDVAKDKAGIMDFVNKAESNERPAVARKAKVTKKKLQSLMTNIS